MPKRQPILAEDGTHYKVPIGKAAKDGYALVDKDDMGGFAEYTNWRIVGGGYVGFEVYGKTQYCAHWIMQPETLETVWFKNGDKKDLRRSNLEIRAKATSAANAVTLREKPHSRERSVPGATLPGLPFARYIPSLYTTFMQRPIGKQEVLAWIFSDLRAYERQLKADGKSKAEIGLLKKAKLKELFRKYKPWKVKKAA